MQRDAEDRRLLLVRHRRLDGLDPADDLDPVAVGQKVVERRAVEVLGGEARDERLRHVQGLDRHRLVVGQPEPLCDDNPLGRRHVQAPAEIGAGVDDLDESVRLPGRIPRRRISSLNDDIVSSCAIFGSLTYVPLPRRRTR